MKRFQIYGDYGLASQQLLEDFALLSDAKHWFDGYTRRDLGGYISVEVVSFLDSGEVVTHYRVTTDEDD